MNRKNTRMPMSRLAGSLAIALFGVLTLSSQQLQKGVSVTLANTENALPIVAADYPNAWIVTITADGTLYFGVNPITPDALITELTRRGHGQNLFIKADASAPYAAVESALNAARRASFTECVLLTAQREIPETKVLPKGLEVSLKSLASTGSKTPRVEMLKSSDSSPTLKINGRPVPWPSLQNALTKVFLNQTERDVLITAEGTIPFDQVAHAIDVASSVGAGVILMPPT